MKTILTNYISKKISKDEKAEKSILQAILGLASYLSIDDDLILDFIEDAENDNIFSSLDFIDGGNWCDSLVDEKYLPFMKELFQCRPIGLGTPNAACGEGELMLILSSPQITRPTQNDILIGEKKYNLKDTSPRIFSEITGKDLNKKLIKICEEIGFQPNVYNSVNTVQLVNKNYVENHWNKQFENSTIENVKKLLSVFLISLFPDKKIETEKIDEIINNVLENNLLVWDKWIKELIIFIYKNGVEKNENLVLMEVNGNVKSLPSDQNIFSEKVMNNQIIFTGDYFRMNQKNKTGLYLNYVN